MTVDDMCTTCGLPRSRHTQSIFGERYGAIIDVHWCADTPGKKGLIRVVMCRRFKSRKKPGRE